MYIVEQYDDSLLKILRKGNRVKNRTGIDTISLTSVRCEYDISNFFPVLTKRKLYPKSVFAELIWMLSGSTNNEDLVKLGCKFWTPWVDETNKDNQQFYEKTKFPKNHLGPVYGWQMRHFGADYYKFLETGVAEGFDQISWLINEIKKNPISRRLIVSLWNPPDLEIMRLPPCHYCFHIFINDSKMTLLLNQRSCDMLPGISSNILFYSALCYMLAQQTGCIPHKFIHHMEDAHVYVNQIEAAEKYLAAPKIDCPKLNLKKKNSIFDYCVNDFEVVGYNPNPPIKVPVAV